MSFVPQKSAWRWVLATSHWTLEWPCRTPWLGCPKGC
jgi:hypothetical protein